MSLCRCQSISGSFSLFRVGMCGCMRRWPVRDHIVRWSGWMRRILSFFSTPAVLPASQRAFYTLRRAICCIPVSLTNTFSTIVQRTSTLAWRIWVGSPDTLTSSMVRCSFVHAVSFLLTLITGPLCNGATSVLFEPTPLYPDAGRYWHCVQKHKVNTFYTSPTAIRALMKFGTEYIEKYDLSSLRVLGTVGEPINPAAWEWYSKNVGKGEKTKRHVLFLSCSCQGNVRWWTRTGRQRREGI